MKKILFLTPDAFRQKSGGSIVFGELFNALKKQAISWFICSESSDKTTLRYNFKSIAYYNSPFFKFPFFVSVARHFSLVGIPFFILKYKIASYFCAKKVIRFVKKEGIDLMWVYAYHFSIPVAKLAHEKLQIPIHLSIQDDIYTHLALYESKLLDDDFKYLLENASTIDFTSEEMGRYYNNKYKVKAKTMTFMVCQRVAPPQPIISEEIKEIGYAGNIWCKENFEILLEALEELDKQYDKLIRIHLYTNSFPVSYLSKYQKYILLSPVVRYEELIDELQNCDILYLTMSFMQKKAITNITSFPSKILTYMNSQVPILNHSPLEAVSNNFVIENKIGYSITSPTKKAIIDFFIDSNNSLSIKQRSLFSENAKGILDKYDTKKMTDDFISLVIGKD